jgi:hypothetical protein
MIECAEGTQIWCVATVGPTIVPMPVHKESKDYWYTGHLCNSRFGHSPADTKKMVRCMFCGQIVRLETNAGRIWWVKESYAAKIAATTTFSI